MNSTNVNYYLQKEKALVEMRIKVLLARPKLASRDLAKANDDKEVLSFDLREYNDLLVMKAILDSNFTHEKTKEYRNIRARNYHFGRMSDKAWALLIGEKVKEDEYTSGDYGKDQDSPIKGGTPVGDQGDTTRGGAPVGGHDDPTKGGTPVEGQDEPTKGGTPVEGQDEPTKPGNDAPVEDEEPVEVKKTSVWKWIKDHKKQILIALGITALAVTSVIVLTQLLPAIVAAAKASQVAGLASQMVNNAAMWHGAIASEQLALHGANTALANTISSISGVGAVYTPATGVWTMGAQVLPSFAQSAAATATSAAAKVSALKVGSLVGSLGGLGLTGAGLLLGKRSEAYKAILTEIEHLRKNVIPVAEEVLAVDVERIGNRITTDQELSNRERNVLAKKLNSVVKKNKTIMKDHENTHNEQIVIEEGVPKPVGEEPEIVVDPTMEEAATR